MGGREAADEVSLADLCSKPFEEMCRQETQQKSEARTSQSAVPKAMSSGLQSWEVVLRKREDMQQYGFSHSSDENRFIQGRYTELGTATECATARLEDTTGLEGNCPAPEVLRI